MKFTKFEVANFKGIRHAALDLMPAGANVFTLIGLNESGKTTILEAIDDFPIKKEGQDALYGEQNVKVSAYAGFVPKHKKADFTGTISVKATVQMTSAERDEIASSVEEKCGCRIIRSSIPLSLTITRGYRFVDSDYKSFVHSWDCRVLIRSKNDRKDKPIADKPEIWSELVKQTSARLPKIVYFPTFLFSIPDKIVLNPDPLEESSVNELYRQIIQDVASSLPSPLDIQKHIVDRIVNDETLAQQFVALIFLTPDKQQQINATLNALSDHLTRTVFGSWGKIFSGDFTGKEIQLRLGIDNEEGAKRVHLKFVLKDGPTEYDVAERSLGFRWFFSFLLFTLYRVYAKGRGPTLFLLDEPASNLHARAQMQLLDSFARIADGENQILYSTHSHYMINPEWLDQAFVVSNNAIDYTKPEDASGFSPLKSTEVDLARYRSFVGNNPDKTTYFQPVLDKLDVVPSKIDLARTSLLVEGKGDYFILEYGRKVLLKDESDVAIVPTRGATGMDELIGLFLGWGIPFAICLDDDKEGKAAKKKYVEEWGLTESQVFTFADVEGFSTGDKVEDALAAEDHKLIAEKLSAGSKLKKGQIQLFFSEALARRETLDLSEAYRQRIAGLIKVIAEKFPG